MVSALDGSQTILQNLAGKDSLIGRSMSFNTLEGYAELCCIIGRDMGPELEAPETATHTHTHSHKAQKNIGYHPQQYYSYPQQHYSYPQQHYSYPQYHYGGW